MVGRSRQAVTRTQEEFPHRSDTAVVERFRLLSRSKRCHLDYLVTESIRSLTPVKASDPHQAVGICQERLSHDALAYGSADEVLYR